MLKENDIICLVRGIDQGLAVRAAEASREALDLAGFLDSSLYIRPLDDGKLTHVVGEVAETIIDELESANTAAPSPMVWDDEELEVGAGGPRVVLILTSDRQRLFKVMRGFKSVVDQPQDVIFAMITETAATWTVSHYFSHLSEEHEYMKTHSPEGDPDMRVEREN